MPQERPEQREGVLASKPMRPIPHRSWVLSALLLFDRCLVVLWGWCCFADEPNLLAYLQIVGILIALPVTILAIIFVTRRPIVLEDALRQLGTRRGLTTVILAATVSSLVVTAAFWLLTWIGSCISRPLPAGRIAFTSERDQNREICVMNADGSDQTRLTVSDG